MLEIDLTVQNSVIFTNGIIKVTWTWMIMILLMTMMIVKVAQKMNKSIRFDDYLFTNLV